MSNPKPNPIIENWLSRMKPAQFAQLEAMPVRRDMVTLLTYLREHKITGTQSTGNLPLKAVREVTARFVNPPVLDEIVGEDHIYRLRSESNVWSLYFLHIIAEVSGLMSGAPGQKLHLTAQGLKFLQAIPPVQVWFMLSYWWWRVNWLVAYQVIGMGDQMPPSFQVLSMEALLKLPVGKHVDYNEFADRLMQRTGYRWSKPDLKEADEFMREGIRKIMINILERFECVELKFREKKIYSFTFQELGTFCITPLGKGLLKAVDETVEKQKAR